MLSATVFGMQLNKASRPHTLDRLPEHKEELSRKQIDSMVGGSWSDSSTMASSEVVLKMEQG
jgi:hypothetical protein